MLAASCRAQRRRDALILTVNTLFGMLEMFAEWGTSALHAEAKLESSVQNEVVSFSGSDDVCVWERERVGGGEGVGERECVRIHMSIELVCSKGGPQALPIWCWRFYYSFRDVMAKGGGRRWGVCGEGMEGGTMAHEGKVSQYYVFSRWQRQMKPCFCLQTSNILTPRSGAVRRCAVEQRPPGKPSLALIIYHIWTFVTG